MVHRQAQVGADEARRVAHRRGIFLLLNLLTLALAVTALGVAISGGGIQPVEVVIAVGSVLTMPYTVLGFWNAVLGLWLRHARPQALAAMPGVAELTGPTPRIAPVVNTVLLVTLRNEPPAPIFVRIERMRASLRATGQAGRFTFAVLSDSDQAPVVAAERVAFAALQRTTGAGEPVPMYRNRPHNEGYKAGNIGEFLDAHGSAFRYALTLDSDSLMSGGVMLRLVAAMEAHPRIGILQTLAVGMPSTSGFTRISQFGMRHAMRVFTTGVAWWSADCGPYWGHNAILRVTPFSRFCRLPRLPGGAPLGGAVLSHDQLEAAFMRRAGYQVRVMPVECESYEINPPTLLAFIRRELRWCHGNLRYLRLLGTPGLRVVSRIQLLQAVVMYIAPPAWIAMMAAVAIGALDGGFRLRDLALGTVLFVAVFLLAVTPKIAGTVDVWLTRRALASYGGGLRFFSSALLELLCSMLAAPVVALSTMLFIAGLLFGRVEGWGAPGRVPRQVGWRDALLAFAPHTLFGVALTAALVCAGGARALIWAAPVSAGLLLSIPYAVLSTRPALGAALSARRLFASPEELAPPALLQ